MRIGRVAKHVIAAVAAAGTALSIAAGDDVITATEAVNLALAVLAAVGVYVVPNSPESDSEAVS